MLGGLTYAGMANATCFPFSFGGMIVDCFFSVCRIPVFFSVASLVLLSVCAFAVDAPRDHLGESVSSYGQCSYGQLTFESKDQVRWDEGGNDLPRTESLSTIYRRLGGSQRPTLVNLLNLLGANGWELVQREDDTWTFKR